MRRYGGAFVLALLVVPAGGAFAAAPRYEAPELAGVVLSTELGENSGFAVSRRRDGLLWAVNDNQNTNRLYALETSGSVLASLRIEKAGVIR